MTTQAIASILKNIIGKPCWNVKKGYGSFITFEFGSQQYGKKLITKLPLTTELYKLILNRRVRYQRCTTPSGGGALRRIILINPPAFIGLTRSDVITLVSS